MCQNITDLLGELNANSPFRIPFVLIDASVSSIVYDLELQLKAKPQQDRERLQLAFSIYNYAEFLKFSSQLIERMGAATKTNVSTRAIHSLKNHGGYREPLARVLKQMSLKGWLRPEGIGNNAYLESLLEDARDIRKGLFMLLFCLQLYDRMRPYLRSTANALGVDGMHNHLVAYDALADARADLIRALMTECASSNMDSLNDAVREIASAMQMRFCVASDPANRPSSVPSVKLPLAEAPQSRYAQAYA